MLHYLFLGVCVAAGVLALLFPEKISEYSGHQMYVVLTDSMEPRIPVFSLVVTRRTKPDETLHLQPGQIITFRADRFGDPIVLTHHFHHKEVNEEGDIIYRTNAEGEEELDYYETKREDIIGTYRFHIPWVGKVFLFLKSDFGYLYYGEMIVIFLMNKLLSLIYGDKLEEPVRLKKRKSSGKGVLKKKGPSKRPVAGKSTQRQAIKGKAGTRRPMSKGAPAAGTVKKAAVKKKSSVAARPKKAGSVEKSPTESRPVKKKSSPKRKPDNIPSEKTKKSKPLPVENRVASRQT